jgi:hypothetical protein
MYEDMEKMVRIVRESDRDWTIIRVPRLVDGAERGDVRIAWVGKGMRINRADMAKFMLEQIKDETYAHKAPAISN